MALDPTPPPEGEAFSMWANGIGEREYRFVCRLVSRMRLRYGMSLSTQDVEDIAHRILLATLEYLPEEPVRCGPALVTTIAKRQTLKYFHRRRHGCDLRPVGLTASPDDIPWDPPDTAPSPEDVTLAGLDLEDLTEHVRARISPKEWDLWRMRYLDDLDPKDIAEIIGTTPATVSTLLSRIKRKLAPELARRTLGESDE